MKKRMIKLLLSVFLLTVCVAGLACTVQAAETYGDFTVETEVADGCSYTGGSRGGCLTINKAGTYTVSMATGKTSTSDRIVVDAEGVTLVLNNVKIKSIRKPTLLLNYDAAIRAEGTVSLESTADGTWVCPGIDASGKTMTFLGGVLKTTGTTFYAAGNNGSDGGSGIVGNLIMQGGTLEACGNDGSTVTTVNAESGGSGISGTVTIYGGNLIVTGGMGGDGVGGGSGGSGIYGNLTVHDGTVTVTGGAGGKNYSSSERVGPGGYAVTGQVQIDRGTVTATGGRYGDGSGSRQAYQYTPTIKEPTVVTLLVGTSAQTASPASNYRNQSYAKYVVLLAYPIQYEGVENAVFGTTAPTKHAEGTDTVIPDPTRANHHFDGWMVNGVGEPVKALTLQADAYTDVITLTAVWTEKETYPLVLEPQRYVYDTEAQAFVLPASLADSVSVEYSVDGSWTAQPPVNAGIYHVKLTRPEDETYKSVSETLTGGLVIEQAMPVVTPPTVKTGLVYTGEVQELITAGITSGGTLLYSVNGGAWSEDIPTGTESGSYQIGYYVQGDANYKGIGVRALPAVRILPPVTACDRTSCPMNRYTDADPNAWYHHGMHYCLDQGILKGVDADSLAPNDSATRAQVVTMLWRVAGSPAPESTVCDFTDVGTGAYYYKAMLWAVENGITRGMTETEFAPDALCTRAQVVTFLWRAAGQPAADTADCGFTDLKPNSYYSKAVLWAVENGITNGVTATTFAPDDSCTRAQIATFLYRYDN